MGAADGFVRGLPRKIGPRGTWARCRVRPARTAPGSGGSNASLSGKVHPFGPEAWNEAAAKLYMRSDGRALAPRPQCNDGRRPRTARSPVQDEGTQAWNASTPAA